LLIRSFEASLSAGALALVVKRNAVVMLDGDATRPLEWQ
jgi:hypothetical protein